MQVGIVGSGAMGSGIAQVVATAGDEVRLFDANPARLSLVLPELEKNLSRLVEKGKLAKEDATKIVKRVSTVTSLAHFKDCDLIVEAIVEDLAAKQSVFSELEKVIRQDAVLATNTSSLSIASIGARCVHPERVVGIHFFNPAPLMQLVEIVPSLQTSAELVAKVSEWVKGWSKLPVVAKDTPGFIVNRIARPFYGEALRILEEGIADAPTIDWAMKHFGGFRMGPFELMDFIGHDVNYAVTESVFAAFYFDPRYRPSLTQKRLVEANLLGRKTGRGFYDYRDGAVNPSPREDEGLGSTIFHRIISMLINEATEALHLQIATRDDIDLAMTKGVNYPKGLLKWADELGMDIVFRELTSLCEDYAEDRYRPSVKLRRMARDGAYFY